MTLAGASTSLTSAVNGMTTHTHTHTHTHYTKNVEINNSPFIAKCVFRASGEFFPKYQVKTRVLGNKGI